MRALAAAIAGLALLTWMPAPAEAQSPGEVFRRVSPSVVVVRAGGREVAEGGQTRFRETGSGVLVSPAGKVITAAHVVHAMDEITVEFLGGESVTARVVASEPAADLALLQLDRVPAGARAATLADSDTVQTGDEIVIIGAPFGLIYSLSAGLISARWAPDTVYRAMPLAEFFQTDAVINTGNSGGPMFSMTGEVVGIVSHIISRSGGSEGLGFVVTINTARDLLLAKRSFWGGLEGRFLTEELADLLNVPAGNTGYLVKTVAKDSPGARAGLRGASTVATILGEEIPLGGDIILEVEGVKMTSTRDLFEVRDTLGRRRSGEPLTAVVLRAGRVIELVGRVP
jgi:S1-C subfamily serine protease